MRLEEQRNDVAVVWLLHGRLTGESGELLRAALSGAILVGRPNIVIDMSDVSMIDAGGLGSLATIYRACAVNLIALSLARVPTRVRQLLAITRLTVVLRIFDSVEDACASGGRGTWMGAQAAAMTETLGLARASASPGPVPRPK